MTPRDLAASIPFGPNPPRDIHISLSIALLYLSEHFYEARTESGMRVSDPISTRIWLAELAAAINLNEAAFATKPISLPDYVCPECKHEHRDRNECGAYLGEGKFCHCESKVMA